MLPPHTIQYHGISHLPPYAGPDLVAYRPTSFSSGSHPSPVNLVGPFLPGFSEIPRVLSDFPALRVSDKVPPRSDIPPAGDPIAQSEAPSRRRQSQPPAVRHVQSSGLSRASGTSFSRAGLPGPARTEEPRKRRVVVRFPPAGTATTRSPLPTKARETIEQTATDTYAICVALAPEELVSRGRHFDEISSSPALPQSLDVYLPGREAWQDVWEDMQESFRVKREPYVSSGGLVNGWRRSRH